MCNKIYQHKKTMVRVLNEGYIDSYEEFEEENDDERKEE